jgi:hypothetical protein
VAEQPERAPREEVVVFTGDPKGITEDAIKELQDKFGLEVKVRSSVSAIDSLIARAVDVVAYDRTHPGYDRVYDRDPNAGHLSIASRINPAELIRELEAGEEKS